MSESNLLPCPMCGADKPDLDQWVDGERVEKGSQWMYTLNCSNTYCQFMAEGAHTIEAVRENWNHARARLGQQSAVPQWVKCSERMPEQEEECWFYGPGLGVLKGYYVWRQGSHPDRIVTSAGDNRANYFTHWMPYELPAAPAPEDAA
jgi:hypothetical protein